LKRKRADTILYCTLSRAFHHPLALHSNNPSLGGGNPEQKCAGLCPLLRQLSARS
jgi:hypothetical protein